MRAVYLACCCCLAIAAEDGWVTRPPVDNVIVPQARVMPRRPATAVRVTGVQVLVRIVDRVATTTLDVQVQNPTGRPQEAELVLPLPPGAVVGAMDFGGTASEPQTRLLRREEARRLYESIVASMRDPALVEFAGNDLLRSSVFPVPAQGSQRIQVTYEQVLELQQERCDYVLPRSAHLSDAIPWTISVEVQAERPWAGISSTTHHLVQTTTPTGTVSIRVAERSRRQPGAFRLHLLGAGQALAASVLAYPDRCSGGGYFMLQAAAPDRPEERRSFDRECTLVIDRSGSMNGDKIAQVRAGAKQVIGGLAPGETFNVIIYHHGVERFAPAPVVKNAANERAAQAWLDAMLPRGGTNIGDALFETLRQPSPDRRLGMVLFLTDGIATVGETAEAAIRRLAERHNPHDRRIFTIGVGADVNTHLLEKLADDSRAVADFIRPGGNVETTIATVFERLRGPVLADCRLAVAGQDGRPVHGRVIDRSPAAIGDLFVEQELLVVGRYTVGAPLRLTVAGQGRDGAQQIEVTLDPAAASVTNAFVPRLWASRTIAQLIDQLRSMGATDPQAAVQDPRYRELIDEIVALSVEYGVLTEYTAFFSEDGSLPVASMDDLAAAAEPVFRQRALSARVGLDSLAQSVNNAKRKGVTVNDLDNGFLDAEFNRRRVDNVQALEQEAYYRQAGRWVAGSVIARDAAQRRADREVAFASPAYFALAQRLLADNRQAGLAVAGDVLLDVGDELVLVRGAER